MNKKRIHEAQNRIKLRIFLAVQAISAFTLNTMLCCFYYDATHRLHLPDHFLSRGEDLLYQEDHL